MDSPQNPSGMQASESHPRRFLQEHRDTNAAERFFRALLSHAGATPERITTDKLGSYATALRRVPEMATVEHQQVHSAMRCNNRMRAGITAYSHPRKTYGASDAPSQPSASLLHLPVPGIYSARVAASSPPPSVESLCRTALRCGIPQVIVF